MAFCSAVTLCFAAICAVVSAALLAIAFSTGTFDCVYSHSKFSFHFSLFQYFNISILTQSNVSTDNWQVISVDREKIKVSIKYPNNTNDDIQRDMAKYVTRGKPYISLVGTRSLESGTT